MSKNQTLLVGGAVALLAVLSGWAMYQAYQPKPYRLQGEIEARQYHVSSKVPGRVAELNVRRGDKVVAGDLLYTLSSPELEARLQQAKAGVKAAEAMEAEADAGARRQQIQAARDDWQRALAAANLYKATYQRVQALFDDGVVARQKRDEAYAQWQAAQYQASAAEALYQMAEEGARKETREAAQGQAEAARGQLAEVQAVLADSQMRAPRAGEIAQVLLQEGELAPQGFPVVTLVDMGDAWALFQVREDRLSEFPNGAKVTLRIPALDASFPFEVAYRAVQGEFATWRATESGADFDMRTFEVELRPLQPIAGLRAGMTVLLEP
ncbi:HlyD family secretion protein [Ferrimonas balearica]|uniref:HlyD family secretion protein n=1 Tax=Ferrimonas balearica TaxID=44012 RepID=UPI001C95715D|nr:biotin/lipoyl-binding protein [Ferrimonas balearica]MBY6019111.1 efflux RND transporter periplasmic adaptor subunit [Halomonas denitrificans]MBY6095715.1 efflux RND transporter periplasmic adaptor subunit [Ferrimonas balearica]MBY6225332.1 efflux RND transporter periplasmic adaptor subunit [Ferrimonas balearica]